MTTATRHPIHPGTTRRDRRYAVAREYCGHRTPQWVARFCGDWIGCAQHRPAAVSKALAHHQLRQTALNSPSTRKDHAP
jgi:hypothetical protein